VIPIHINKLKNIQSFFKKEIDEQRTSALQKLNGISRATFAANEITFLDAVINQITNDTSYLTKTPSEIETIKNTLGVLPRFDQNGIQLDDGLKIAIQNALDYKGLRKKFYPKYFRKIGIKSCVYCNSQLTIAIAKNNKEISARFEVDHHDNKDEYPYLSISLFNLYPCCSSCNKRKMKASVNFKLYTDDNIKVKESEYKFEISKPSKCAYLLTKDIEDIKIDFHDTSNKIAGQKSLQDVFNIKEIHDTQKDIVAELILKNQVYNQSFKETLQRSFSKLSLNQNDFDRVIIGNYTEDKDIHKRPFSKMTMDIAKQLGLIKKRK
jgi:hypothetical protein